MRQFALSAVLCLAAYPMCLAQEVTQIIAPARATGSGDAASFYIGYNVGSSIAQDGLSADDIKQADFVKGLLAALNGDDLGLAREDVEAAMQALTMKVGARMQKLSKENLAAAEKFLEANKSNDGVQVTDSGLQYKVIKSGAGAKPVADSTVLVNYEGKLQNGKVFDSTGEDGPAELQVGRVIPGWTEALLRMRVGDKWQLFIPPNLGYAERGSLPRIGPNALLVFSIELVEVK